MKYDTAYCGECLKPCREIMVGDGNGVREWWRSASDCCHEEVMTRRDAMSAYATNRETRAAAARRMKTILDCVDSIVAEMKKWRRGNHGYSDCS